MATQDPHRTVEAQFIFGKLSQPFGFVRFAMSKKLEPKILVIKIRP
jgi:hypothetical protein